MSFLAKLLPTIASCFGSPLAGAAVEAVGKALGMSDATADKVQRALTSGNLTAEQIAALQAADMQLKTRMAELGIDAEKLAAEDRNNARDMQTTTGSWVPSALACSVTVGYFAILIGLMSHRLELGNSEGLTLLLGSLTTAWGSIVAFYYGASHFPQGGEKK